MATGAVEKTYLLVHGAWHGGWCWRRVVERLEGQGRRVVAPTLTGLGERAHLLTPTIDLDTHIADVVNVAEYEELDNIVLVGHSYAGFVIAGAVEQLAARVAALVFLDAFVPDDGDSMAVIGTPTTRAAIEAALARGETTLAPRPAALFHVNEADRPWVDRRCGPHPIGTFTQAVRLSGACTRLSTRAYIRAAHYPNEVFDATAARLRSTPGWHVDDVPCGHDVMIDMPDRLVAILDRIAQ